MIPYATHQQIADALKNKGYHKFFWYVDKEGDVRSFSTEGAYIDTIGPIHDQTRVLRWHFNNILIDDGTEYHIVLDRLFFTGNGARESLKDGARNK